MSDYPTKLYPAPPKAEWFMRHTSLLNSAVAGQGGFPADVETSFQKMGAKSYAEYLSAHNQWLKEVETIKTAQHWEAVKRRGLEQVREVVNVLTGSPSSSLIPVPGPNGEKQMVAVNVRFERKKETKPEVSKKPHQSEKRAQKVELTNAKTKAKVEVLKARVEVAKEVSSEKVKSLLVEKKKIDEKKALWSSELSAAKSAAQRAKHIKFGSVDFVTNIEPENGWKVVTRKKGANVVASGHVTEGERTVRSFADPGMKNNIPEISAFRKPTAVRG